MNLSTSSHRKLSARNAIAAAVLLSAQATVASQYLVEVSPDEHTNILREHERNSNSGATTEFDAINNRTRWLVGRNLIAVSEGPVGSRLRYWSVVNLTPQQHAFAADQVSNNDVSGDEEMIDHFFFEAKIIRAESLALMVERNRCLVQPFFEPLQDRYSATAQ